MLIIGPAGRNGKTKNRDNYYHTQVILHNLAYQIIVILKKNTEVSKQQFLKNAGTDFYI